MKVKNIVIGGILGTCVLSAAVLGLNDFIQKRAIARQQSSDLVAECMSIGAGSDGVLDNIEGIKMARALGYKGAAIPNEQIILRDSSTYEKGPAVLVIGYEKSSLKSRLGRDHRFISEEDMETYIESNKQAGVQQK